MDSGLSFQERRFDRNSIARMELAPCLDMLSTAAMPVPFSAKLDGWMPAYHMTFMCPI